MTQPICKSIYDLADLAGVSYATVSRVLNGHENVSAEARKAVLDAVALSDFKPRMKARRTTVALILDLERSVMQQKHGYVDSLLLNLVHDLSQRKVALEIFTHNNRDSLNSSGIDGVIALDDDLEDIAHKLKNLPTVVINGKPDARFSRVCSDHVESGKLAAEHLLKQGKKRCAILLDARNWGNEMRLQGFAGALADAGVPLEEKLCGFIADYSAIALLRQMYDAGMDSLFLAGEDNILEYFSALQAIHALDDGRILLMSMDDPAVSRYLNPPLSTVAQPIAGMLQFAVESLLAQIGLRRKERFEKVFANQLIVR